MITAFDDNNKLDSLPDGYVRDNKILYIFEMKDNLISSDVIVNGDFESIKGVLIDKFFISRNRKESQSKGIKQLVKTIKHMSQSQFSFDEKIKINKTKVYPIIIYTDSFCSMPGVNDFLNGLYQEECTALKLNLKLANLTLINLETMFKYMLNFKSKKFKLNEMIDDYHIHLNKLKKNQVNDYPSFDLFIKDNICYTFESENFVSEAFSCFDLKADFSNDITL